jgi:hypothetical protein
MPIEVVLVAVAGMVTFLVMILIISKAETEKARATAAGAIDGDAVKRELADNAMEIARLRNRVEVLERLATDSDRTLANDINRLRNEERV